MGKWSTYRRRGRVSQPYIAPVELLLVNQVGAQAGTISIGDLSRLRAAAPMRAVATGDTWALSRARVLIRRNPSFSTGSLRAQINGASGGFPTATVLATSPSITVASLSTTYSLVEFALTGAPLASATQFCLVMNFISGSGLFEWGTQSGYPGGNSFISTDGGASWITGSSGGPIFDLYGFVS